MRRMTCGELDALAPELALDLLSGDERGAAFAHLEQCPPCQREVARYAESAEALLTLAPRADLPAGFEQRVLAEIEGSRVRTTRARSRFRLLAAAVTTCAIAVASFALGPTVAHLDREGVRETTALATTTMRTLDGELVGAAYHHRGDDAWIAISAPEWNERLVPYDGDARGYTVRVRFADGTGDTERGQIADDGTWIASLSARQSRVTSLEIIGDDGAVWCTGRFS